MAGKTDVEIFKLEIDLQAEVRKVLPKIGEFTANEISWNSPVGVTEEYAEGWTSKMSEDGRTVTVYNDNNHDFTNLTTTLEKGHLSKNGSWVPAQPHIKPAYNTAKKEYLEMLKNIKIKPK